MGDHLHEAAQINKRGKTASLVTIYIFFLGALLIWRPALPVNGQTNRPPPSSTAFSANHTSIFQKELRFDLNFVNDPAIQKVTLYLQAPNFRNSYRADFQIEADPGSHIEFNHVIDLATIQLDPFSTMTYWWTLENSSGELFESEVTHFVYQDDRYQWEHKEGDGFVVHWTTGQGEIGQVALEIMAELLPKMGRFYDVEMEEPVALYIYPSAAALQSIFDSEWIGGVATPSGNRLFLPAANARTAVVDFRRQIPHELSHLYFAQLSRPAGQQTTKWLDEGLAVYFEDPPNRGYAPVLTTAFEQKSTIPFELLCDQFPTQSADQILLAYAQSGSMINYIDQTFGRQAINELLDGVEDGLACGHLVQNSLGISLEELQGRWLVDTNPVAPEPRFSFFDPNIFWMIVLFAGFGLMGLLAIGSIREV